MATTTHNLCAVSHQTLQVQSNKDVNAVLFCFIRMISPDEMESSIALHGYSEEVHFQTVAQSCFLNKIQRTDFDINYFFNDYA